MTNRTSSSVVGRRRGFTLYLMFLLLFLMIFSGFLTQSIEILALAGMQSDYLSKESKVKSGSTWYLENLLGPAELE
ncbi:MAG: hypothetical protein GQF41_0363 [Candidatus Rifleibacterium amylolyticum]|nr:MAG: hypothetical protein GQF41_0363 [Candidatus Rifleibacterium amylolyticum]